MKYRTRLRKLTNTEGTEQDSAVLLMKARSELITRNMGNHMVYPDKTVMLRDDQITMLRSLGFDLEIVETLGE